MGRALLSLHGVTVLPGAHRAPLHESTLAPQLYFCTAPDNQYCPLQLQTLVVDTQHPGAVDTSKKQPAKLYYHSPVPRSSPSLHFLALPVWWHPERKNSFEPSAWGDLWTQIPGAAQPGIVAVSSCKTQTPTSL